MNEPTPLPHTLEGERSILSCILLDGPLSLAKAIDGKIDEECFYEPAHRKVWKSIQWLHRHNKPFELSILAEELKKRGLLEEVGGIQGLVDCTKATPTTAELSYWIEEVRKCHVLRQVHAASLRMQERVLARSGSIPDFVQEMNAILSLHHASNKQITLGEAAGDAVELVEKVERGELKIEDIGYRWPWRDWDNAFGVAKPGELIIICARPGVGKSSIARQTILEWSKRGTVLLFSREMNVKSIAPLFAQLNTGVSWKRVIEGKCGMRELDDIKSELRRLERCKTIEVYDADRTLAHIVTRVRAVAQTTSISGIVVDYLQRYDPQQDRGETRDSALGRFTTAMKDLAVDLKVPIILLAQISRSIEKENRKPRLSDIRETAAGEADADKVIFLTVPEHMPDGQPQNATDQGVRFLYTEATQAKGRGDGMGTVGMLFDRPITKFLPYTPEP